MKKITLLAVLLVFSQILFAEKHYKFTTTVEAAYKSALALKFNEAKQLLAKERKENPENLMPYFVEDYIDFYTLLVDGSTAKFKKLSKNKSARIDKLSKGDALSPYSLYTRAEIKIHWAILRSQYGDELTAFRELRSAYKMLKINDKQFPRFIANKKSLGMLRTIFSAIPDGYKWSARAMGVNGDFNRGYREIKSVLAYAKKHKFLFEAECRIIYSFLLLGIKNDEKRAWQIINHPSINPKKSMLACFIQADVAMKTGRNDKAIQLIINKPKSKNYYKVPLMSYFLGVAKLRKLDKNAANQLHLYLKTAHSTHYFKATYLYLAWHAQIFGSKAKQKDYLKLSKVKGSTKIYDDKKASVFGKETYNTTILKAQMLFDGGYYTKVNRVLLQKKSSDFSAKRDKINHYFLLARAAHKQKKYNKAIDYYKKTLAEGSGTKYFFVCYSALNLGKVYEVQKNKIQARKYYNQCAKTKSEYHQSSYHKQAKEALKRL